MWVGGGGVRHSNCNASLIQPNAQINIRAHVRGGVGLNFEKKNAVKNKTTPKKKLGLILIGSPIFGTFSFIPTK